MMPLGTKVDRELGGQEWHNDWNCKLPSSCGLIFPEDCTIKYMKNLLSGTNHHVTVVSLTILHPVFMRSAATQADSPDVI